METIIFGLGHLSKLAAYVLARDSAHRPVAFTVHDRYVEAVEMDGVPVLRFEDVERAYPPGRFALLAPLGWSRMGDLRAGVLQEGRAKGYRFIHYVSSRAITPREFSVRDNCMIFDGAIVEAGVRLGENTIVRSGAFLGHEVQIGSHAFVAPRAVVGTRATVGENCFLGLNCVVQNGIRIAPRCFITAGAVVTSDTEPGGIYRGSPARRSPVPPSRLKTVGE